MFTERHSDLLDYFFSWVKDPDKQSIVVGILCSDLEGELQEIWGLTELQVEGLRALVRREGENYLSYIRRIREVESARKVYLSELRVRLVREVKDLDKHWKAVTEHGEAFGILSRS